MKRNVMIVFIHVCIVILLTGLLAMQFAHAADISHKGTATVKAMDLDKDMVKLAHGPIASLNWPAMTMNFRVKERALMQGIKVNDPVTFTFIQSDGGYVVTHIQPSK